MSNTICPYPGLRPFNEEESIFFKGREQQVERLVKRLEEKKFLMLHVSVGDGKSSLIYTGVIPYAKAGFFKAKYNNCIVADFRPERSPLKNLTTSLCKQFKIDDHAKTEKELGYGFSAMCDLYKRSSFIDFKILILLNSDEKVKKASNVNMQAFCCLNCQLEKANLRFRKEKILILNWDLSTLKVKNTNSPTVEYFRYNTEVISIQTQLNLKNK